MKLIKHKNFARAGITLVEMMVSAGVLMLLGLVFFSVLNSGMILFAKNTAINAAHAEGRDGINRLTRDIHASISVPELRDTNLAAVPSTPMTSTGSAPMAAGISFQNITPLGPQFVWKDQGTNKIMVKGAPGNKESPEEGMRMVAPLFGVEENIVKVTATPTSASHHNVWLENSVAEDLVTSRSSLWGDSLAKYSLIYYTYRNMYLVRGGRYIRDTQGPFTITTATATSADTERFNLVGTTYIPATNGSFRITPSAYTSGTATRYRYEDGELHFYQQSYNGNAIYWKDVAIVARYISNPRPFYIPLTSSSTGPWYESTSSYACYTTSSAGSTGARFASSTDTRYVGVKLTAHDPKSSNRGYIATATLLNTQIDYRSRLALRQ